MVMSATIRLKTLTFSEKCYAVSMNNEQVLRKILKFFNHVEPCQALDFVAFHLCC